MSTTPTTVQSVRLCLARPHAHNRRFRSCPLEPVNRCEAHYDKHFCASYLRLTGQSDVRPLLAPSEDWTLAGYVQIVVEITNERADALFTSVTSP